jgi:hypothetical protein
MTGRAWHAHSRQTSRLGTDALPEAEVFTACKRLASRTGVPESRFIFSPPRKELYPPPPVKYKQNRKA